MKCTKTITDKLLERWRAGEPSATAELLFSTGLWHKLLKHVPPSPYDAAADALLQVLDELRRREGDLNPKQFMDVLCKQYRRRWKDFIIAESGKPKRLGRIGSLDAPWISGGDEGEEVSRIEHLQSQQQQFDPEYNARSEQALDLTLRLLQMFFGLLGETFQRHFQAVECSLERLEPWASQEERAAMLFEFLHLGRTHIEGLADLVIATCCGNRDTFDSAHNWRLRKAWQHFIGTGGRGQEDFACLQLLMASKGTWTMTCRFHTALR